MYFIFYKKFLSQMLSEVSSFSIFGFIPPIMMCVLFYILKKKNKNNVSVSDKKDDLWVIVKEYLKLNKRSGLTVQDLNLFQRPKFKELNGYIYKSLKFQAKENSKQLKIPYIKPRKKKKYLIEEYFEELEKSSYEKINEKHNNSFFKNKKFKNKIRKRYVVVFRTYNQQKNILYKWEAIEIELFKNENVGDETKYRISFNKKLDYKKELSWMFPMQFQYEQEKYFENSKKNKKIVKKEKIKKFKNKIMNFIWKK